MSEEFEYAVVKPSYNVPDVAMGIFATMVEQDMKNLWYIDAKERKAMIHECFLWAEDFCSECRRYEEEDDE